MSTAKARKIGVLMRSYHRQLTHYTAVLTGDLEKARDLVQESILNLWQADLDRITPSEKTWLFRGCRSAALDWLKRVSKEVCNEEALRSLEANFTELPTDGFDELMQAINELPESQAEVIRMKFQFGFNYAEIGAVTGLAPSSVGSLIHVGVQSLRQRCNRDHSWLTRSEKGSSYGA